MIASSLGRVVPPFGLAAVAAIGGMTSDTYVAYVIGIWCVYSLAGIGLMLPVGWLGEISVGHAGVMAVAAYASALGAGGDMVRGALLGIAGGLAAGLVLGLPSLRLRGFGLAIATLVFGEIVRVGISNSEALGGTQGRYLPALTLLDQPVSLSGLVVAAAITLGVGLALAALLRDSSLGRAWRALRDNEDLARAFGAHPPLLRLTSFLLSGIYAGLAGVFLSWHLRFVQPNGYDLWLSVYLLAIVLIGGRDETYGPLLGAAVLVFGAEYLRVTREVQAIVFGLAVLLVVWRLPQGLATVLADPFRRRLRARARKEALKRKDISSATVE